MSTWACISARNEARSIERIVKRLIKYDIQVAVVDAGSTDGTGDIARAAGAIVTRLEKSRGIAGSLMAAWEMALFSGAQRIVQLDAGGSHDPNEAVSLLSGLSRADMVIGSRFIPKAFYAGRPWRRDLSQLSATLFNWKTHQNITDWTSGYRAMRRRLVRSLLDSTYHSRMHGWQIETLGRALNLGAVVIEMPIFYRAGRSSFRLGTVWEAFAAWRRLL